MHEGVEAFREIYRGFVDGALHDWSIVNGRQTSKFSKESCDIRGINDRYLEFYREDTGDSLGKYFRTLYNIIAFVDAAADIENKTLYTNLLRAQLSRPELGILFYNCLSDLGNRGMKRFVLKYDLLCHLEMQIIPEQNRHLIDGLRNPSNE